MVRRIIFIAFGNYTYCIHSLTFDRRPQLSATMKTEEQQVKSESALISDSIRMGFNYFLQ